MAEASNWPIILIVDDDEILRMVLHNEFKKIGFKVREADNGKVGLASLVEIYPDVIITDIEMPVMDGFTLIRAVRKIDVRAAIPIIVLSAMKSDDMAKKALAAGANQFFPKPFHLNNLVAAILGHLSAIRRGCR